MAEVYKRRIAYRCVIPKCRAIHDVKEFEVSSHLNKPNVTFDLVRCPECTRKGIALPSMEETIQRVKEEAA